MTLPSLQPVLRWWSNLPLRTKGLAVVTVPLCTLLVVFALSFLINREQDEASKMVARSMLARFETHLLLDRMSDAERAVDTYALVHDAKLLEPYRIVTATAPDTMVRLAGLVTDDASQTARLQTVQSSVTAQLTLLQQRIDSLASTAAAGEAPPPVEGQHGMPTLRREIEVFDAGEQQLQANRSHYLTRIEWWRTVADGGGILIGILGALVAVRLFSEGGQALAETLHHLRKSEELYRALAHNFPNGSIFLFDHDLRYLVADGSDLAEFGFSRGSLEGRTLLDVLPEETTAKLAPFYRATLNGETRVEEFPLGDRTYLMQFLPLRDEAGTIYAGLLINQNISARKRAEEALRLARDEAERANRAKSQFLSRMSHELRTPLNAILGFGQILELSTLPDQEGDCVRHVLKAGRHLLALVDEVLDLARVEAGELRLKPSSVRVDTLAHECISFLTMLMRKRDITCTVEDSPAFQLPVWADKHRLRQVMLNLISNATKYNREKGLITLACRRTSAGGLRLEVRDTGRGMSAADLARLFVPFERLEQEYGEIEGSGLGLVISKQLVEAMNGSLGASSEPDVGTTFWIELPEVPVASLPPPNPATAGVSPVNAIAGGPATVLCIEDNSSNLGVVEMLISRVRPAWRFLAARDGYSGVEAARKHRPSCILLDLQLPGMNGDLVLAELRAHEATRDLPVILVSADVMTHNREALLAFGATDYLPKPFDVSDLLGKLDQYMVPPRGTRSRLPEAEVLDAAR